MLIGGDPIASFTDGTTESDLADAVYEDIVRAALTSSRWNFATKQFELNRLVATPVGRWDAAYQVPSDSLMINAVTVQDLPINYDIYEDQIFNNAASTDSVIADYIYRASEATWAPYFTLGVEFSLASVFALSVTRKADIAQSYTQLAEGQFRRAKARDSQQVTNQNLRLSRYHRARLGNGIYQNIEGT